MGDPHQLYLWALSLQSGGPLYDRCAAIAMLRGREPWDFVNSPFGGLSYWQGIALEVALSRSIADALPGGPA